MATSSLGTHLEDRYGIEVERITKIASKLKATVIIQHDARDVDKLPVFPASAK